jgi:ketosteroid isomerase-like protein
MSQENVERFREATEAFNRWAAAPGSDASAFLRFVDPEIQFEPVQAALQGRYVGLDGVRAWLADLAEHYERGHVDYTEIRDLGSHLLAVGTLHVIGRGSGIEIAVPMAVVASLRDGRISRFKDYGDKDQALEAAGLSE